MNLPSAPILVKNEILRFQVALFAETMKDWCYGVGLVVPAPI